MNIVTMRSFVKEAGLLQNIGMRIAKKSTSAVRAAAHFTQEGIQNAGSAVSAFATPVDSFKKGVKATFDPKMPAWQKGALGIGALSGVAEVAAKEDPLRQGRSRIERASTVAGDQIGGIIGAPFGLAGGVVGSQIGRKAGMLVGKGAEGASKLLKRKKKEEPSSPSP